MDRKFFDRDGQEIFPKTDEEYLEIHSVKETKIFDSVEEMDKFVEENVKPKPIIHHHEPVKALLRFGNQIESLLADIAGKPKEEQEKLAVAWRKKYIKVELLGEQNIPESDET